MSRLMADQESRGGNKRDSGTGADGSIMHVNLAEGCGAVNGKLALRSSLSCSFGLFGLSGCISLTR